jgi:hypothetical protein
MVYVTNEKTKGSITNMKKLDHIKQSLLKL